MLEQLLPPPVIAVETFTDDPSAAVYPGEEDLIAKAVEGRRREFVTARACAREALRGLGFPARPIRPGTRREPLWPTGVAGSITHCSGYRAAAVCRTRDAVSVGIDAEPEGPLPEGVLRSVATEGDQKRLAALPGDHHWDRLLFSAKESVYKAWYPLTHRWLGFDECELYLSPDGDFTGRLLVPGHRSDGGPALTELRGRFLFGRGIVLTAVTVAR